MVGMAIGPANRLCHAITAGGVRHPHPAQIGHRAKDATGDQVALHLGKPEFNRIEPRRSGRHEMLMHGRVRRQEVRPLLGLAGGGSVQKGVCRPAPRRAWHSSREELDREGAGGARNRPTRDFPGARVFKTATSDKVSCWYYSNPCRSARPGGNATTGWRRSMNWPYSRRTQTQL